MTGALFASPLYAAIQRYVPGAVGVNGPDVTVFVSVGSGTIEVKIGAPVHVALFGPYSVNVTVAPACGSTRPLTVALSVIVPFTVAVVTAFVAIVGVAWLTTVARWRRCTHP